MKKYFLFTILTFLFFAGATPAQDVATYQVPGRVMTKFQQQYPDAKDVDWELKDGNFEVDFELGFWGDDYEILYDSTGRVLRHKSEISKKDLPGNVTGMLDRDFKWYWIKDVKKIVDGDHTIYLMDAWTLFKEWELTVGADGTLISQFAD